MMASLECRLLCKPLSSSYLSSVPRNLPRHDSDRFRKPMACVMKRLKLESTGTAKQKPLTVEPMFLLPRRFGLMFLAWLAARSGLTTQCLCCSLRDIPMGKIRIGHGFERHHGQFQHLLGLAGVWIAWPFMSTSSVGRSAYSAKQASPVSRHSHVLLPWSSLFLLCSAYCAHVCPNHITQRYHCDALGSGARQCS